MQDNFTVSTNQLIAIKLSRMRSYEKFVQLEQAQGKYLDCAPYRQFMHEISTLLAYEVAGDLLTEEKDIETSRGKAQGVLLKGNYSVLVPILRTGLSMAEGFQMVLSHTHTGHIGLHHDKDDPDRRLLEYLVVLPNPDPPDRLFIILDPVIATGETAHKAITILKNHDVRNISFACLIASRHARAFLSNKHPDVRFYATAIDDGLDPGTGRVIPGLGAVSELLFGYKTTEYKEP